jgi:hypothetical protein
MASSLGIATLEASSTKSPKKILSLFFLLMTK